MVDADMLGRGAGDGAQNKSTRNLKKSVRPQGTAVISWWNEMNSLGSNLGLIDEDALILMVQRGDLQAFEPLVDQHLPHVRAFIALRTPAAHLVDELAHETFVYAFRNIHEFVAGSSFANWLRSIAWNLLRAEILRFSREQANHVRYAQARRVDLVHSNTDLSGSREAEFLEQCVDQLPGTVRELLTLKYHGEHSSQEIAQRLKRSTAWVWTMLFRLRQQLKQCIESKLGRKPAC
jgi:RNA polymerase sigma-70 factor (ECF subfamily)